METPPPINRELIRPARRVRRRGLRRVLLVAVVVLVLVLLVVTLVVGRLWFRTTRELEKLTDDIREAGYPVTAEELSEWYDPGPGSADAGIALTKLFDTYMAGLEYEDELLIFHADPNIRDPITKAQIEISERHLSVNSEYLKNLHRLVAEHESVRYPVDVTQGFNTKLEHNPNVRRAVRMMAVEALVGAHAEDETQTVNALVGAFRVADTLRHEPIVISQLVRIACLNSAFNATEQVVNRSTLSSSSLEKLQATVEAIDCDGPMALGLAGERSFLYSGVKRYGFAVIESDTDMVDDWAPLMKVPGVGLYLDWELLHIIEAMTELVVVGDSEPVYRRELGEGVKNRLVDNSGVGYFLANILVPSFARMYEAENQALASTSVLTSSLATLRFQHDYERMPIDLQELVPEYISEVPTDPFSGDPLRMRSDETGFVVYSLGHDRDDDGGNPPPEGESLMDDGDIVFRILLQTG